MGSIVTSSKLHIISVSNYFSLAGDIGALGWWDLFINFGYSPLNVGTIFSLISITL